MRRAASTYHYPDASRPHTSVYLWPAVVATLEERRATAGPRVFELGCGNGSFSVELAARGFDVTAVDPSVEGIRAARTAHPGLAFFEGSSEDDLAHAYGRFPAVVSLEVVEHVYDPRAFVRRIFDLLEPGGMAILSTPYHSYLKNLVLAASGRLDAHFTALTVHGHIKFWSRRTIGVLLEESGFEVDAFLRVGRIPALAKSMIVVARRPSGR